MATLNLGVLGFELTLNKQGWNSEWKDTDKQLETQSSKFKQFGTKISGIMKAGIATAATAAAGALVALAKTGVDNARQLSKSMAEFSAHTGMVGAEADKVKDIVKELYKVNEDSYEDLVGTAEALHNLMGMNADDIGKYAQNYLDYAKVTKQANADAVAAIDDVGDAWGLTADESVAAMDMILVMNQQYGADINDTQNALKNIAPAAKAAGFSMEESAGFLAMFAASGVDASTASTAFSRALQKVKSPDELRKLIQDIMDTEDPFERAQKASELFGTRAGPQMAAALGEGSVSIDDFIAQMQGAEGAVTAASAAYDDNFDTRLALLQKKFGGIATEIGEKVLPIMEDLMSWAESKMPQIEEFVTAAFDGISTAIDWVVTNVWPGLETALNGLFGIFETIWPAITETVSAAFEIIGGLFEGVSALLQGDWAGAWESFSGVISTVTELWQSTIDAAWSFISGLFDINIEDIGTALSTGWEAMKTATSEAWEAIKSGIGAAWDTIAEKTGEVWTSIQTGLSEKWEALKTGASETWENVKAGVSDAWENVKSSTSEAWESVKSGLTASWDTMKSTASQTWSTMKTDLTTAWNNVKTTTATTWNNIKTDLSTKWSNLKTDASTTWENIKSSISTAWDNVKSNTSTVWGNIKTDMSSKWGDLKSSASDTFGNIKSSVSDAWNSIKSTTTTVWNNIKSSITSPIEAAKKTISDIVGNITGIFNGMKIKIPEFKLPQVKVEWIDTGVLGVKYPKLSVNWHAEGAIFMRPTLLPGMDGMHGVGEAGAEAVLPIEKLRNFIRDAMNEGAGSRTGIVIIQLDGREIGRGVFPYIDEALGSKTTKTLRGVTHDVQPL